MAEDKQQSLFIEKNLKKATDPEQLNAYLKVTGFRVWFVLLAAALILGAIFIWAVFGTIQPMIKGAGYCTDGTITCYFVQDQIKNIDIGDKVDINGNEGMVADINSDVYLDNDIPNDVLFLLPESRSGWYSSALISCSLADGLYSVVYYDDEIHPISFLAQGNESR